MTRKAVGITAFIGALVLVAAGALTLAGSNYISGNIHDQLASQKISFAPKGSPTSVPCPRTSSPTAAPL